MKKYFVLIGLFIGCLMLASGYPRTIETQILPSATSGWDESIDNWRPIAVDSNGKLITGSGADVAAIQAELLSVGTAVDTIASSSAAIEAELLSVGTAVDTIASSSGAIEAELLSVGTAVDTIASSSEAIEAELLSVGTAVDTIASSSEAIDNNTKQCSQFKVQVVTLTANTSHLLVSGLNGDRKFVEVKSHLPNQQFWVDFTATAAVNLCRPCTEYFYAEVPSDIDVAIIASSAMTLSVVEGGL